MAPPAWAYQPEYFMSPPDDELICSICSLVFCEPTECPCQHAFCKNCICQWLNRQRDCPICRKPVVSAVRPSAPFIRNLIAKMKMRCHNKEAGCDATFTLESCEHHLKECMYELVECLCGKSILRKDVESHSSTDCRYGHSGFILADNATEAERERNLIERELQSLRGSAIGKMAVRMSQPEHLTLNCSLDTPAPYYSSTSNDFDGSYVRSKKMYESMQKTLAMLKAKRKRSEIAGIRSSLLSGYPSASSSSSSSRKKSRMADSPYGSFLGSAGSSSSFFHTFSARTSGKSFEASGAQSHSHSNANHIPFLSSDSSSCTLFKMKERAPCSNPKGSPFLHSATAIGSIHSVAKDIDTSSVNKPRSAHPFFSASSACNSEETTPKASDMQIGNLGGSEFLSLPSTSRATSPGKLARIAVIKSNLLSDDDAALSVPSVSSSTSSNGIPPSVQQSRSADFSSFLNKLRGPRKAEDSTDVCDIVYDSRQYLSAKNKNSSSVGDSAQKLSSVHKMAMESSDDDDDTDSFSSFQHSASSSVNGQSKNFHNQDALPSSSHVPISQNSASASLYSCNPKPIPTIVSAARSSEPELTSFRDISTPVYSTACTQLDQALQSPLAGLEQDLPIDHMPSIPTWGASIDLPATSSSASMPNQISATISQLPSEWEPSDPDTDEFIFDSVRMHFWM